MKILSIESSADETGISILEVMEGSKEPIFNVLGNSLASQIKLHTQYGGIFPALAKREHQKNLPILLNKVLKKTKLDKSKKPVDMIAVTYGPGLEPALWTGIVFAKELAEQWNVPIIPVNHMEGHILSVFAKNKGAFKIPKVQFPILSLLVSGGHTELVLAKDWMKYKVIGETLDDAAGEAFDKVARMLALPYPGGPEISRFASEARKHKIISEIKFPRPMMHSKNFDFSFSGLKTAVLYFIRDLKNQHTDVLQNDSMKMEIAREFEDSVVDVLTHKTMKAIEQYKVKTVIVAGGVSANKQLKKILTQKIKTADKKNNTKTGVLFPGKKLSTDNAVMISLVGYFRRNKAIKKGFTKIKAVGGLQIGK